MDERLLIVLPLLAYQVNGRAYIDSQRVETLAQEFSGHSLLSYRLHIHRLDS